MSPEALEGFLRAQFEPLQYAAFFGVFALFAALEGQVPRDAAPPERLRRWSVNIALTVLNIIVMGAMPVGLIAAADFASAKGIGLLNVLEFRP